MYEEIQVSHYVLNLWILCKKHTKYDIYIIRNILIVMESECL